MTPSESTARSQETAVYSQGGFELPPPAELARRLPNLEVLELLGKGSSLRQLLEEGNGSIAERRTLDFVLQITECFQHAHEAGVIFTWAHEPLKPGWTETQATLDFQPRGNGTHLVLSHERFRSEPNKRDHTNGWCGCLNRLSLKFGG